MAVFKVAKMARFFSVAIIGWVLAVLAVQPLAAQTATPGGGSDPYARFPKAPFRDLNGDGIVDTLQIRPHVFGDDHWRMGVHMLDGRSGLWQGEIFGPADARERLFGWKLASGPDVDGDGMPEFFISSPLRADGQGGTGVVYIFSAKQATPIGMILGSGKGVFGADLRLRRLQAQGTSDVLWLVDVLTYAADADGSVYDFWTTHGTDGVPIGDAAAGTFQLKRKAGDVDRDGSTNYGDLVESLNYQFSVASVSTGLASKKYDIDSNGTVDGTDLVALVGKMELQVDTLTTFEQLTSQGSADILVKGTVGTVSSRWHSPSDERCFWVGELTPDPGSNYYKKGFWECCSETPDRGVQWDAALCGGSSFVWELPLWPEDGGGGGGGGGGWWPLPDIPGLNRPAAAKPGFYRNGATHGGRQDPNRPQRPATPLIPNPLEPNPIDPALEPSEPEDDPFGGGGGGGGGEGEVLPPVTILTGDIEQVALLFPELKPEQLAKYTWNESTKKYDVRYAVIRVASSDPSIAGFVMPKEFSRQGVKRSFIRSFSASGQPIVESPMITDGLAFGPIELVPSNWGQIVPTDNDRNGFIDNLYIPYVQSFDPLGVGYPAFPTLSNASNIGRQVISLYGFRPGSTNVRLEINGNTIASVNVHVGGTVAVAVHDAPKFMPDPGAKQSDARWNNQALQDGLKVPDVQPVDANDAFSNTTEGSGMWPRDTHAFMKSNGSRSVGAGTRLGISPSAIAAMDRGLAGGWYRQYPPSLGWSGEPVYDRCTDQEAQRMGLISVRARDALGFFKPNRPVSVMSVDSKLNFAKRTAPTFQPTKSGGMGRTGDSLMLRGGSNPGQAWRTSGYGTVFKVTGDDAVVRAAVSSALTGQANTQAAFEAHGGNARMTVLVGVGGLTIAECAEPAAVLRAEQWNQSQLAPRRSVMNGQALILDQFPSARTAIAPTTAVLQSGSITKRAYTSRQGLATTENGLGQSFDTEATAVTVPVPIFNQYDAILMQAHLVRGRLVSPPSPNAAGSATPKTVGIVGPNEGVMRVDGGDGTLPTGYPGALHSQDGNPAPFNEFTQASFSAPWRSALDLANHARTQLGTNDANFNAVSGMFTEMPQNVQKVDFATPLPPASDHREGAAGEAGNPIVEWGGLAADLGLSFVPGYDVKDAVIYGFWKPIFGTTEEQNNVWLNAMTATFSVLGLAADAGYFAGPAGFATNAMPALLKTFTKWCAKKLGLAENIFERMLKFGADAREAVQHKLDWIGRSWKQSEAGLITGSITQVADKLIDWSTTTARNAIETFLRPDRRWHSFWGVDPNAGIDRVRKGMNAYQNLLHREFKVLAPDAAKLQGTARAMDRARAWMRGSGVVMNETDVQLAMRAVRGQPARVAGMSDEAYNALLKNGDEAMVETSETFNRVFNQAEALPVGPGRERLENTVRDALENARQVPTSHLRGLVDAHVGPDKAFKTMQQFEALRVLPVEHLTDAQKAAMRALRESIGGITAGTPVTKYIKFDTEFGAFDMLQNGKATMNGFIARTEDVAGLGNTRSVIDRLRLDTPNSAFAHGLPTARIETVATPGMAATAKIPTSIDPAPAGWVRVAPSDGRAPFTGNGFTGSLDGHLTPELQLTAAQTMVPNATYMRLRQADGVTAYTYTNPITGQTASDWVLKTDLSSPSGFKWEPAP